MNVSMSATAFMTSPGTRAAHERGAALITALVFLVLLTLLGIAALNTTSLQEKMAGSTRDRNLAFQAAEAALMVGESYVQNLLTKPVFPNTNKGLYLPSTTGIPNWDGSAIWSGANVVTYPSTPSQTVSGSLGKVLTQPKYFVEDLGEVPEEGGSKVLSSSYKSKGKTVLRITARGTGGTNAAQVILQSTYGREF